MVPSKTVLDWSSVIALFGGHFDPPHLGHRQAIYGLLKSPGIQRIQILPTARPPHKNSSTTLEQRLAMTSLNFENTTWPFQECKMSCCEVLRAQAQPQQPSYSFDTLTELRKHYSEPLAFVIGSDTLKTLSSWYRFPHLLNLCHWLVLLRAPDTLQQLQPLLEMWYHTGDAFPTQDPTTWRVGSQGTSQLSIVTTQAPQLSSSWIRQYISQTGHPPHKTLLPTVAAYIKKHQLYQPLMSSNL